MTENFAQTFYLKAEFDAAGRESVPQRVKIRVRNIAFGQIPFESVLYGSRVGAMIGIPRKDEVFRSGTEPEKQFRQKRRKRNDP